MVNHFVLLIQTSVLAIKELSGFIFMQRILFLGFTAVTLIGCVSQPPAPIEYGNEDSTIISYGKEAKPIPHNNHIDDEAYEVKIEKRPVILHEEELEDKPTGNLKEPEKKKEYLQQSRKYIRPVDGFIITGFGEQTPIGKSNGINIEAPSGTAVKSIADGMVAYSGHSEKFGNLIIIKLEHNLYAAYAHMEDLILKKDSIVKQGQVIGHVGLTGQVNEPQLYFAIKEGKTSVDPLKYVHYDID